MLTREQIVTVNDVFKKVKSIFIYKSDADIWGKEEYWEDPTIIADQLIHNQIIGDCDNFALACRFLLFEYNIPNRIAFCVTEEDEGHLVCEAGGYILDNRMPRLMQWKEMPYKWLKISDFKIGGPWREIKA